MRLHAIWFASLLLAGTAARAQLAPQANYQLHCMGCHGTANASDTSRVPSVDEALARFAPSAAGRDYLIRVPGIATAPLSDADLTSLLNWMAQRLDAGAAARFTLAEVQTARRRPLADVARARLRVAMGRWPDETREASQ
jgi:hypothetical protein